MKTIMQTATRTLCAPFVVLGFIIGIAIGGVALGMALAASFTEWVAEL